MAYTTIDKPSDYFETKLWSGNATDDRAISGLDFAPDWVWIKNRTDTNSHALFDTIRGATKYIESDTNDAEATGSTFLKSFTSDGYTLGTAGRVNSSGNNYVGWNWLSGGTAPAVTYSVKVVSDSGNKYRFDDFGTSAVTLDLQEGGTYTFDQSDSSNSGHPLRFSTTSDGTHGGGSEYTTNVTTTGTPGSAGAKTVITVASGTATLYYYCSVHSGMGGQANTNSTFGSSNFGGSIQSNVSANTTAGFSIGTYTGNGTDGATVGTGLTGLSLVIAKCRNTTGGWVVKHQSLSGDNNVYLQITNAAGSAASAGSGGIGALNDSTFPLVTGTSGASSSQVNASGNTHVFYAFAEKKGYSKFGSYTGNGNADGTFIYTGFKPAWVMAKKTSATEDWSVTDNKRDTFNVMGNKLRPNSSSQESTLNSHIDFLSNGFKWRSTSGEFNSSGGTYIYMAFAENPFVTSTGIPTTAR